MNDRLRLKITDKCQRSCELCSNKYFPDVEKFDFRTAFKYKEVYLTGGEPMLDIMTVKALTTFFTEMKVKVFIYSSMCCMKDLANWSSLICDYKLSGITFTVHELAHMHEFKRLDRLVAMETQYRKQPLSLRFNRFDHFDVDYVPVFDWSIKKTRWIENCPMPAGEDFRRL